MKTKLIGVIVFLFLTGSFSSFAQTKDDLEKKKSDLVDEINGLQKELDVTKKNKNANLNQLTAVQEKIKARQKLINAFNSEVVQINAEISKNTKEARQLDGDLDRLKKNYSGMVVYAYKHRSSHDRLLFLFSAESFNDAWVRLSYMKRYNAYRHMQAAQIKTKRTALTTIMEELKVKRAGKKTLMAEQEEQKKKLTAEKNEKDQIVKSLGKQEKSIKTSIDKKKKEQDELKKKIADLIKKEIEAEKKKNTTTTGGTSTTLENTPEFKALSASFVANMGKLPWPVEKGYIIETFGTHKHPDLKNVTTKNNGVDIKTQEGAPVRAVFKGTVVSILSNPGYHKAVLVKHGEYYTVYSNLASVSVKANQQIDTKQTIGTAYTDKSTGMTTVHLEVWKGTALLNPESWISGK